MEGKLVIKKGRDCFGCTSYVGYKGNVQITDVFDDVNDLIEYHSEFKNCTVIK